MASCGARGAQRCGTAGRPSGSPTASTGNPCANWPRPAHDRPQITPSDHAHRSRPADNAMTADALPPSDGSLNRRIARGAAWMVGLHFVSRCIGFVSTIVLARMLVPADFGLVAIAMALVASVAVFGEFGFELALIQNQKAERSHYDTAWTLGLLRSEEHTSELQSLMRTSYAVF